LSDGSEGDDRILYRDPQGYLTSLPAALDRRGGRGPSV